MTPTPDQMREILEKHARWVATRWSNSPEGERANLRGAYLRGANLRGADLRGADLGGALKPQTIIETGETWSQYLGEVVPALLKAGGKTIKEILAGGAWECHSWENCPMAIAFDVHKVEDAPIFLRPRIVQFIRFFDAQLIPKDAIEAAAQKEEGEKGGQG